MSFHFVKQRIEELLANPDFQRENEAQNPNTPEAAIATALRHLAAQYSRKTETEVERIGTLWSMQNALNDWATRR